MQLAIKISMVLYRNNLKKISPNQGGRLVWLYDYQTADCMCLLARLRRKVFLFSHGCSKPITQPRLYVKCNDWRSTAVNSNRAQDQQAPPAAISCHTPINRNPTPVINPDQWTLQPITIEGNTRVTIVNVKLGGLESYSHSNHSKFTIILTQQTLQAVG